MTKENKNFMEELRNKLISDKYKEHLDELYISQTLYRLLDENKHLKDRIDKAINFIDQVIQFELLPFDYHKTDNHLSILIGILKGGKNE